MQTLQFTPPTIEISPSASFWPGASADATVPLGQVVTLDEVGAEVRDLIVEGDLLIDGSMDTSLKFRTMRIEPTGRLIGNVTSSCSLTVRDTPLVAADTNGIKCFGTFHLRGQEKDVAHMRLAVEALAGHTTLTLERVPTGWQAGDSLFVPGSRQLKGSESTAGLEEWEYVVIAGISGNVVTLTAPLVFAHPGARNQAGVLEFMPVIQNLSRNVVIRSENMSGVRGHTWFEGRADVDIRYVKFGGLGRRKNDGTGGGAVPIHLHHLIGPATPQPNGYQFTLIGNVVTCPLSPMPYVWPITLHDAHYGLVKDNDCNNWSGAGIVTWDGSETQNVIEGNRVMRMNGSGERIDSAAEAGSAFWFRGPDNYVRNNVAANVKGGPIYTYGYNYFCQYLGVVQIPAFQGADKTQPGQSLSVDMPFQPLREFSGNEVFGTRNGMTYWWIGCKNEIPGDVESVIQDFKMWNVVYWGIFAYQSNRLVFDNLRHVCKKLPTDSLRTAITFSDYFTRRCTIRNSRLEFGVLVLPKHPDVRGASDPDAGKFTVHDTEIVGGYVIGAPPSSVNGSANISQRVAHLIDVEFVATLGKTIELNGDPNTTLGDPNYDVDSRAIVTNYDGGTEAFIVQPAYRPPLANPLPDRSEIVGKLFAP